MVRDRRLLPSLPDHKLINHNRLTVRHYFGQIKDSRTNLCRPWTEKLRPARFGRIVDGCGARAVRQPTDGPADSWWIGAGTLIRPVPRVYLRSLSGKKREDRRRMMTGARRSNSVDRSSVRLLPLPLLLALAGGGRAATADDGRWNRWWNGCCQQTF